MFYRKNSAATSNFWKLTPVVIKRMASAAGGLFLMLICFADFAYAANGNIQVISCLTCVTSQDYVGAAKSQAKATVWPGTYIVVNSAIKAATAFVVVTGTVSTQTTEGPPQPVLLNIATDIVDMSGNSLAGYSEASLETYFSTMDQTYFGTNRDSTIGYVNVPESVEPSFINSDLEVVGAQISNWINSQYNTTQVPLFTVVTLQFSDGTYAQFQKINATGSLQWQWNGLAWKKGPGGVPIPIDHSGNSRLNPNSGGNGTGSTSTQAGQNIFNASAANQCVSTTSVTWGGVFQGSTSVVVPC